MNTLNTLGDYREFCAIMFGDDSPATRFFDRKIATQGRDEKVVADESQMLLLIGSLVNGEKTP
jgi:hypothetical protein